MHALSNHSSISLTTLGHHIHLLGREKTEQVAQARLLMEKIDRCPKSILFDTQSQVKLVYKEIKNGPFFWVHTIVDGWKMAKGTRKLNQSEYENRPNIAKMANVR